MLRNYYKKTYTTSGINILRWSRDSTQVASKCACCEICQMNTLLIGRQ